MDNSKVPGESAGRVNHLGQWVIDSLKKNPNLINQLVSSAIVTCDPVAVQSWLDGSARVNCRVCHLFCLQATNFIVKIDGYTDEKETNQSVLKRSVSLATSLVNFGLKVGDVLALAGRNHNDVHIPYYAALYTGLPIFGVDPSFKLDEVTKLFSFTKPKVVFCQESSCEMMQSALDSLGFQAKVITFDGEYDMKKFINEYQDVNINVEEYRPIQFDTSKVYCWLTSTSGSTGIPKAAAFTHDVVADVFTFYSTIVPPRPYKVTLNVSPLSWFSSYISTLRTVVLAATLLQTSGPNDISHLLEVIRKYKPTTAIFAPTAARQLLNEAGDVDLTCFNRIILGGSKVEKDLILGLKEKTKAFVSEGYGQTEVLGPTVLTTPDAPIGSCGKAYSRVQLMLVNPESGDVIEEPNKSGELYVKSPGFSEYYNNPEQTAQAFTEDGWFKTGDLLYRDENYFYYYVDRIKNLITYKVFHVSPVEVEEVIRQLDGVLDVAVVGVPHDEDIERIVACVITTADSTVTADDVKNIVAAKLSDAKRLRGGVLFVDEFPMSSTGKVLRYKLKPMVIDASKKGQLL